MTIPSVQESHKKCRMASCESRNSTQPSLFLCAVSAPPRLYVKITPPTPPKFPVTYAANVSLFFGFCAGIEFFVAASGRGGVGTSSFRHSTAPFRKRRSWACCGDRLTGTTTGAETSGTTPGSRRTLCSAHARRSFLSAATRTAASPVWHKLVPMS